MINRVLDKRFLYIFNNFCFIYSCPYGLAILFVTMGTCSALCYSFTYYHFDNSAVGGCGSWLQKILKDIVIYCAMFVVVVFLLFYPYIKKVLFIIWGIVSWWLWSYTRFLDSGKGLTPVEEWPWVGVSEKGGWGGRYSFSLFLNFLFNAQKYSQTLFLLANT